MTPEQIERLLKAVETVATQNVYANPNDEVRAAEIHALHLDDHAAHQRRQDEAMAHNAAQLANSNKQVALNERAVAAYESIAASLKVIAAKVAT